MAGSSSAGNADIINPVENLEALNTLNARFLQGRGYRPYFAKGKDTYTGRHWVLDSLGTVGAGKEKTIKRAGQPMALNNGGDTVELINPDHLVVQTVTYHGVGEEEMVFPAP